MMVGTLLRAVAAALVRCRLHAAAGGAEGPGHDRTRVARGSRGDNNRSIPFRRLRQLAAGPPNDRKLRKAKSVMERSKLDIEYLARGYVRLLAISFCSCAVRCIRHKRVNSAPG